MTGSPSQLDLDLDAEADEALEAARSIPCGPEKIEALKRAGLLRRAEGPLTLGESLSRSAADPKRRAADPKRRR
jgi:hypothetical protein